MIYVPLFHPVDILFCGSVGPRTFVCDAVEQSRVTSFLTAFESLECSKHRPFRAHKSGMLEDYKCVPYIDSLENTALLCLNLFTLPKSHLAT